MEDGFQRTWQECCDKFKVRQDRGLTKEQVEDNIAKYGHNGKGAAASNSRYKFVFTVEYIRFDVTKVLQFF